MNLLISLDLATIEQNMQINNLCELVVFILNFRLASGGAF